MTAGPGASAAGLTTLLERLLAAARGGDWDAVLAGLPALARANAGLRDGGGGQTEEGLARLRRDVETLLACATERRAELAETLRAARGRQRALSAYAEHH